MAGHFFPLKLNGNEILSSTSNIQNQCEDLEPILLVHILGRPFQAFLNTGAYSETNGGCIGQYVINYLRHSQIQAIPSPTHVNVNTAAAGGQESISEEVVELDVSYCRWSTKVKFLLTPTLNQYDIILGTKFICDNDMILCLSLGGWAIGSNPYELHQFHKQHVGLGQEITYSGTNKNYSSGLIRNTTTQKLALCSVSNNSDIQQDPLCNNSTTNHFGIPPIPHIEICPICVYLQRSQVSNFANQNDTSDETGIVINAGINSSNSSPTNSVSNRKSIQISPHRRYPIRSTRVNRRN